MTDYVLSAELSLKDKFTAKISSATSKTHNFINKMKAFDDKFKKIENRMNSFSKKLDQATNNADKLKNKLDDTQKKFNNFGATPKLRDFQKDMDKALEKIDQTKVKFSNLGSPLKAFEKGFSKSVSLINKVAGKLWKLTKWGVIGGTGLGIGALKIGANFESLKARMVTAFEGNKELAEEHFIWGNKFANDTPFGNDEVLDAMIKLRAYGYKDPRRLMTILGDFAAGNQRSLDDAVEAYTDAANNQFFRMVGFGLKRETVLDYAKDILKDPIPMNGKEIANMDRFMKVLEIMMKERTKDGMKNAMKTLNGMVSTTSGIIKSSIAKLVGVTDEGNVRAGSLIDRVKEKFERFNEYMQSPEGQKAVDRWAEGFVEAIPKIIKIADSIKDKFKEIAGENFMERLNNSINKFDPKNFNKALDEVQKKIDKITDRAIRLGGAFMGMQLAKINPYLGAVAMVGGAFAPELIDAGKKAAEFLEPTFDYHKHRKEMIEKLELENDKIPVRISGATEEANKYLDDFLNGKTKNTGVEWILKADRVKEKIENVKTENQILNDYARENIIINNNNDNRVFNTTTNNYIRDEKTEDNSEKSYNSLNNYESNRIDNSKSITNSETKNNSFNSQNNIDNSKSSVNNNELSNVYNSEKSNDNSKVYNSEIENNNDNSKHIANNKEVSNTHNSSSTNNTTDNSKVYNTETRNNTNDLSKIYNSKTETNDNSKVYNNNIGTKEVKEKVRTLKQNITNHNNITIKIDGAITNKEDKIAYQDIANQLKSELQKTIDKTFENMTTELEFA